MIITLTMNPAVDKTAEIKDLQYGGLNRLTNIRMDAGGKGINVSKTIKSLNGESIALGVVAGNSGDFIEEQLDLLSISHDFLHIHGNTRTNLKVLDNKKVLTEFNETGPSPNKEEIILLKEKLNKHLHKDDILVISGSVPKEISSTFYYEIIKEVKEKGVKVILDADGMLFKEAIKAIPTIIKPNLFELSQYFNIDKPLTEKDIYNYCSKFIDMGVELVVLSMGKDGSYFINKDSFYKVEALNIEAHSSVGAGDAMVASLAYGYENHFTLENLITLSCACSAGAVMSKGTNPADLDTVTALQKNVKYKSVI